MSDEITTTRSNDNTWAIVVWGLYAAGYFTGTLTTMVGVTIAYVQRSELAETPYGSHMTSAIRTFWIHLVAVVVALGLIALGFVLLFGTNAQDHPDSSAYLWLMAGFLVLMMIVPWHIFRIVRGLIRAIDREPIANPKGLF